MKERHVAVPCRDSGFSYLFFCGSLVQKAVLEVQRIEEQIPLESSKERGVVSTQNRCNLLLSGFCGIVQGLLVGAISASQRYQDSTL